MAKFSVSIGDAKYEVNAPDENTAWTWANHHHNAMPSFADAKAETAVPERSLADRWRQGMKDQAGVFLRDIPAGSARSMAGIGSNIGYLAEKAKNLFTGPSISDIVTGETPEIRNTSRKAAVDKRLADVGVDTGSTAYAAGKLGTDIAATLPVGGALAKGAELAAPALARIAPGLTEAIRTGGMSTGIQRAPGAVNFLRDMATRSAGGAVTGGAATALVSPENAGTGAVIGAALPPTLSAIGGLANIGGRATRGIYEAVSDKGANAAAVRKAADAAGDVPQTIADIQTYYPKGAETIPVSAAAITQNPALARLEQGSRLRSGDAWYAFDKKQGQSVFDNVMAATKDAEELSARIGVRAENWRDAWKKADDSVKPKLWNWGIERLRSDLDQAALSAEAIKPGVRNVIDKLRSQIDELGQGFSPSHLQQVRAELNGKVKPLSPSAYESAPRDTPAIISIKQELDKILNNSTGGKWQKVIEGYVKDSASVHQAKAADRIRASFIDKDTGRLMSADPTDSYARITDAGLSRAMNAARQPGTKNLLLSDDAEQKLSATIEALRRQGVVQSVKRTASAGGGSDTASNAIAAATGANWLTRNTIRGVVDSIAKVGTAKTDAELARLLSNPDELAIALGRLTPQQQSRLNSLLSNPAWRAAPPALAGR